MPSISRIRFTNIIYDNKQKRFNDDIFLFDGNNAAILLENGGGKTVFIQCVLQAVIPHTDLGERKIKETLLLDNTCAHIAIEWIIREKPRKYCVTAVSLHKEPGGAVASIRFINEYNAGSKDSIEYIPFVLETAEGGKRPASREEIGEYYAKVKAGSITARTFSTIQEYQAALSKDYGIIATEWRSQLAINKKEGGVEEFFDGCPTTGHLVDNLLIPSIESVIAGEGEKGFAKTFENQRDTFKEYNRLTRLIAESDIAAERLSNYVREYERLDLKQREALDVQKQAKALHVFANNELTELSARCGELERQKSELEEKRSGLAYKLESMAVLEKKEDMLKAEKNLAEADDIYAKAKEIYDEKAGRKECIALSKAKHKIDELEAGIVAIKEEMERFNENTEINELRDIYENFARQLRACYVEQTENIRIKQERINSEIKKYQREKEALNTGIENENKKTGLLERDKAKFEALCLSNSQKITELKQKILIDIKSESIENALSGYNKRLIEIESVKSELDSEINLIDKRISEIKTELPVIRIKHDRVSERLIEIRTKLADTEDKIKLLAARLTAGYKEFFNLKTSNFYPKEKVIKESFDTIIYKAKRVKEEALTNERLKKRLSDAYDENGYFTGAPELYQIIEEIKNKFNFIQAGGQYINLAADAKIISRENILAEFPFWHYSIIVSDADVAKLRQELKAKELSCPVLILTLDKARSLIENGNLQIDSVNPHFWVSNLDSESFLNWKELVKAEGTAAENIRRTAEDELTCIQGDAKSTEDFFISFPHENYLLINTEKSELEISIIDLTERIDALNKELDRIEKGKNTALVRKNDLEREAEHINKNREYAQNILKMLDENKNHNREIQRLDGQISESAERLRNLKRNLSGMEMDIDWQKEELSEIKTQMELLQNEQWYKEVKGLTPEYGNIPKSALIERLANVKLKLQSVDEGYRVLNERLSGYQSGLLSALDTFKNLKNEAQYPWSEQEGYYEAMELELRRIESELPPLKQNMNNQQKKAGKLKDIWLRKETLYNDSLENFNSKYEDLYLFQQNLAEAKELLKDEEASITARAILLEKEILGAESEYAKANQAITKLCEIDREFKFGVLEPNNVEFEDSLNYPYNRLKVVEELDIRLVQAFKYVRDEERAVENARKIYCDHCRREISDVRNRDKLIELSERADNYNALIEDQKAMNASLERAKMLARSALAEREEKMFQFTNHLYTHVEKIAKELLLIPKKTRIKIEDGWKEIFDINFSSISKSSGSKNEASGQGSEHSAPWDENEARMAIRSQINYILDRIENNPDFKTDEGTEDISKIKAFIEKSFKTKQLLKKMMGSSEIRVRCRKVTNDNQVSNRFYSWEESEKWSGGERWSKNMALFLGLQNYIAEKIEPDLKVSKSQSCVLLDNPFGKASSEHVLNPVFFIAKELGFQVITVTAHAEGKFISDYFPVVYSLKLREAVGGKTSVMTKELTVKHAYFEDKDPLNLDRLMSKEQLSLFS